MHLTVSFQYSWMEKQYGELNLNKNRVCTRIKHNFHILPYQAFHWAFGPVYVLD